MHSVFVNSIGQSGTHLAAKCMDLLGFKKVGMATTDSVFDLPESQGPLRADQMPGFDPSRHLLRGVEWIGGFAEAEGYKRRWSQRVFPGSYGAGHLFPSEAAIKLFLDLNLQMVLILREPSAWVASNARISVPPLSEAEKRVQVSVFGRGPGGDDPARMPMVERYQMITSWCGLPFVHVVRFEELVGPKGGGDPVAQRKAVAEIARHCGKSATPSELNEVCDNLFGGTTTFRSGLSDVPEQYQYMLETPDILDALAQARAIGDRACRTSPNLPTDQPASLRSRVRRWLRSPSERL